MTPCAKCVRLASGSTASSQCAVEVSEMLIGALRNPSSDAENPPEGVEGLGPHRGSHPLPLHPPASGPDAATGVCGRLQRGGRE